MKKIKSLFIYILVSLISFPVTSQIVYRNGGLTIGERNVSKDEIKFVDVPQLTLQHGAKALTFKLVPGLFPMMYSSTDTILFRDKELRLYNAIRCQSIRTLSDVRAKADIRLLDAGLSDTRGISTESHEGRSTERTFEEEIAIRFPNLVTRDPDGTLLVNYIELIPVLVNAVNELSEKAARQSEELKTLITNDGQKQ